MIAAKSPSAHQPRRSLKGNALARRSLFSGYAPHSPLRCPAQVHGQCNVLCIQGCRMALVYLLYLYSCRLKCGIPYRNYDTGSYARFPPTNAVPSASYPESRSPRISFRHVRLPAPARHVFRSPGCPLARAVHRSHQLCVFLVCCIVGQCPESLIIHWLPDKFVKNRIFESLEPSEYRSFCAPITFVQVVSP